MEEDILTWDKNNSSTETTHKLFGEYHAVMEKETKRCCLLDAILQLYQNVFGRYRKGEYDVYNPKIFCFLSEKEFFNWILENNNEMEQLFK